MGTLPPASVPPNPLAVLGSFFLHVCGVALLLLLGTVSRPLPREEPAPSLEHAKIVWYFTKDQLPEVAPGEQQTAGKPKVEIQRPSQLIVADAPRPQGKQLIWQPAPKIEEQHETRLPNLLAFAPKPPRPEPRKFVLPERPKVTEAPRVLPEPSPLATAPAVPQDLPLAALPGPARPRRDFVPPPTQSQPGQQPAVILEGAPGLAPQPQQLSLVVVGLDPARVSEIPLPQGSQTPHFSAGADSGAGGGEHTAAAIVVPGLTVHGSGGNSAVLVGAPRKEPLGYHEPSSTEWSQAISGKDSRRLARSMMSAALRPSARVLAPIVESRFPNRSVYTTSFEVGADASMEWVIWFAEQNGREAQYATVRPPVPWTRAAAEPDAPLPPGRFQIAGVIDKNGQLGSITVLSGGDEAARQTAATLVAEWAFLPALRNGEPIAVDTLIEIGFRHRP